MYTIINQLNYKAFTYRRRGSQIRALIFEQLFINPLFVIPLCYITIHLYSFNIIVIGEALLFLSKIGIQDFLFCSHSGRFELHPAAPLAASSTLETYLCANPVSHSIERCTDFH